MTKNSRSTITKLLKILISLLSLAACSCGHQFRWSPVRISQGKKGVEPRCCASLKCFILEMSTWGKNIVVNMMFGVELYLSRKNNCDVAHDYTRTFIIQATEVVTSRNSKFFI